MKLARELASISRVPLLGAGVPVVVSKGVDEGLERCEW